MTSTIKYLSPREIEIERTRLIDAAGIDLELLREHGEKFQLSPEQAAILRELEHLEFLAGE